MKKMITLGVAILLLALTSCSKNNEGSITGPEYSKGGDKIDKGIVLDPTPPTVFSNGALRLNGKDLYALDLGSVFIPEGPGSDKQSCALSFYVTVEQDGPFEPFWLIQNRNFSIRAISTTQLLFIKRGERAQYITLEEPLTTQPHPAFEVYNIYFNLARVRHAGIGDTTQLTISQRPFEYQDWNLHAFSLDLDLLVPMGEIQFVNGVDYGKMHYIYAKTGIHNYKARFELDSDLSDETDRYRDLLYIDGPVPFK